MSSSVNSTTTTENTSSSPRQTVVSAPLHSSCLSMRNENNNINNTILTDETVLAAQEMVLHRHDTDASASSQASDSSDMTMATMASNFFGSIANLCSATLGAGILALPFAFYQAGFVFGSLLLLISAWATSSSIALLVKACDEYRQPTYEKIVEQGLGRRARNVVEVSILIFCLGTAVGYVIAVGDIMERLVYMTRAQKRMAMSVCWFVAMLPLSCLKRMQSLQCASSVGIASIFTLVLAATVHLIHPPEDEFYDEPSTITNTLVGPAGGSWISVVQACPIFFYAFSCQVNVAQIYEELPGRYGTEKIQAMGWVTWAAVAICGTLYAGISIVTLIDFGNGVKPNILSCYDLSVPGEPLLHVAVFAMALAVIMAFPLNIFPARVSIIQMWEKEHHGEPLLCGCNEGEEVKQPLLSKVENGQHEGYDSGGETDREGRTDDPLRVAPTSSLMDTFPDTSAIVGQLHDTNDEEEPEFHLFQHASVTLLLAGLALGMALVIPNISVVFGLLGGTTSSLLGFIVPGLLGLKMDRKCVSAWILVVAGTVIGVLTTAVTVYSTFKK
ncbi:transmembrane amino acid transporter [Nitzschia inconspicua]|uniref:Transmembrane amino acid transporter n=1 Tax=Nitzschia inconspicua TaxID=303405 RepID=A0A9K3KRX1_9STRA|nr:transmembrane amino acid transporter [Nitzschia inconspicua]